MPAMNRSCPHCGEPIGVSRWLRSKRVPRSIFKLPIRVLKCPSCGGMVTNNMHPSERWITGTAEFWAMVVAAAWIVGGNRAGLVTLALVLAILTVVVLRAREQTREWTRFRAYDPNES